MSRQIKDKYNVVEKRSTQLITLHLKTDEQKRSAARKTAIQIIKKVCEPCYIVLSSKMRYNMA